MSPGRGGGEGGEFRTIMPEGFLNSSSLRGRNYVGFDLTIL